MALLGLDIGTSRCKATIVELDGTILGEAAEEYALITDGRGRYEIDPDAIWQAIRRTIRQAASAFGAEAPVEAISVSSFGETLVAVDERGEAIGPSMIYMDARGQEQANRLANDLGQSRIFEITGTTAHAMYSLSKLLWVKEHRPDFYAKVWKWMAIADFVLYRLGAEPHIDYSLAARTMAFDVVEKKWSDVMLGYADIPADRFGTPVQSGTVVGRLKPSLAVSLGLPAGIPLVAGGHDQACAALGTGVIRPGVAVDGMGTTECITPVFEEPIRTPEMAEGGYACVPHVVPDKYVTYAFTFASGSLLRWYREQFGSHLEERAKRLGKSVYELIIGQASPDPSPLLLLPHFAGAATPYMNPDARGLIAGLTLSATQGDLIRALLEGLNFEMMVNASFLARQGIEFRELRAVGGLAKSDFYLQLKADMMGVDIVTLQTSEGGTLGVAALAGHAAGCYASIEEAVDRLVRPNKRFVPDADRHAWYRGRFEQYLKLYDAAQSIG